LNNSHKVILIILNKDQIDATNQNYINSNNIDLRQLEGGLVRKIFLLYKIFRDESIDIVFSYLFASNLVSSLACKLSGVKKSIGGIRSSKIKSIKLQIERFIHNRMNFCTIINNSNGIEYLEGKGFINKKFILINNYIEEKPHKPSKREGKLINILSVGRFHKSKDYFTAISSIVSLRKKYSNFIYTIVGYGLLENEIRLFINEHNASDYIKVYINPTNIEEYYLNADIFLQTSIYEGFSNTIMEALSYSLPVVTTDVGDNHFLVKNKINGYLCKPEDYLDISNKLLLLLNNFEKRLCMGNKSYEYINTYYSHDSYIKKYDNLIKDLD